MALLPSLILLCALPALTQGGPPANDRCVDAISIGPGWVQGTTVGATADGSSTCDGTGVGPDVWFVLTPMSHTWFIQVEPVYPSGLVPLLSVHSGCPGDASNAVICEANPLVGRWYTLPVGQPCWIRVAGAGGTSGLFTLEFTFGSTPPTIQGLPESAIDIEPGAHIPILGTVNGPLGCLNHSGAWYAYTPGTSGIASAHTCAIPMIDTVVAVFDGTTIVTCSDDACGVQANVSWNAIAGRTYRIQVADYWGAAGNVHFTLAGPPRAARQCATAPLLASGPQLVDLGSEASSGSSSCDPSADTAWYATYVAPAHGYATVSTCGTRDLRGSGVGADSILSVHSGCPADLSTQIACSNDDASCGSGVDATVSWPVIAGTSYVVRVTRDPRSSRTQPVLVSVAHEPSAIYCSDTTAGTPCPCQNHGTTGRGCQNSSSAAGALLVASGEARVSADTVTLRAFDTTPSTTGLYFQGTAQVSAPFGDGLRCAGGTTVRLGFRASTAGRSLFGHEDGTGASVSVAGGVPASGGTRHYQLWYRDAQPYCTPAAFNLTNGLSLSWAP